MLIWNLRFRWQISSSVRFSIVILLGPPNTGLGNTWKWRLKVEAFRESGMVIVNGIWEGPECVNAVAEDVSFPNWREYAGNQWLWRRIETGDRAAVTSRILQ